MQVQFHPDTTGQPLIVIAMVLEETSKILLSKLDSQARGELGLDFDVVVSSASSGWCVAPQKPRAWLWCCRFCFAGLQCAVSTLGFGVVSSAGWS